MSLDETIERALRESPRIGVSSRLRREVMEAVRLERQPPLPFPRRRLLAALGLAALAAGLTVLLPANAAAAAPPAALLPLAALLAIPQLLAWIEAW
jgi:hypothetical protein